jgi:uncharacterized membrane protein
LINPARTRLPPARSWNLFCITCAFLHANPVDSLDSTSVAASHRVNGVFFAFCLASVTFWDWSLAGCPCAIYWWD